MIALFLGASRIKVLSAAGALIGVIAAADRALYSAKSKGKNRIEIYQDV